MILYLALIGPGDYWFVTRVLRRPEATWITFPLIVLATSLAAYAGANWLKGSQLRINQVEVVDINTATDSARGLVITHLFSPRSDRYDLGLVAKTPSGEAVEPTALSTAWLGKPGHGLGGMQRTGGFNPLGTRASYTIDPTPLLSAASESESGAIIRGVPTPVWSTKSFVSRWQGEVKRHVTADLTPDGEGLVEGVVTNDSGAKLEDCRLLYGSWAWRLGALLDGQTVTIDRSVAPLKINTLLRENAEPTEATSVTGPATIESLAEHLSIGARRNQASGQPVSRYFPQSDLTHLLDDGGALLLARLGRGQRSELLRDGESLDEDQNNYWVFVRYILPVRSDSR